MGAPNTIYEGAMSSKHTRFPARTQNDALKRQKFRCASCGTHIAAIGEAGQANHAFAERAEGHHVIPHKPPMCGPITLENCVVICRASHLNAHQGGRWSDITIYADIIDLPMLPQRIAKIAAPYPHYRG
jgi:hypothetical protein